MKYFLIFITTLFSINSNAKIMDWFGGKPKSDLENKDKVRFVVENMATLTLRMYEVNCNEKMVCKNRMIMQVPMVAGGNKKEARSNVGASTIMYWAKKYTDGEKKYAPWGSIEPIPPKGAPISAWNGKGGDFGVYTAITKDSNKQISSGQFLHGTKGWPTEGDRFIIPYKNSKGIEVRHSSHACTRVSNGSIIFLRNYLKDGSYVIKLYAKETGGVHKSEKNNFKFVYADGKDQGLGNLGSAPDGAKIIDQGTFIYESQPQLVSIESDRASAHSNPYNEPLDTFKGTFNIDDGTITPDYAPPIDLEKTDIPFPDFLIQK